MSDANATEEEIKRYNDHATDAVQQLFLARATPTPMKLYRYQEQGVVQLLGFLRKIKCAYLADEPGLGKTCQSIVVANILKSKRIIIICPASLRLNWKSELESWWLSKDQITPILKSKDIEDYDESAQGVVIISYDLVHREKIREKILKERFDLAIFDEVHYLKSEKSQRSRFCLGKLWGNADYVLALSGTPVPNNVTESYSVFSKMLPDQWKNFWSYAYRYSNPIKNHFGTTFRGGKNLGELAKIARTNFLVRRLKSKVLEQLPPKIYQTVPIDVGAKDTTEIGVSVGNAILQSVPPPKKQDDVPIATERRELGLKKVNESTSFILNELHSTPHIVVFAYHKDVITQLMENLSDYNISCASITGGTKPSDRQRIVEEFQEGKIQVLVGNIIAAGTGITLTRASTVVYVEYDWTPGNMAQSMDRCHRVGQKDAVRVIYLKAIKTMDEGVVKALQSKLKVINEVLRE